MDSPTRERLRMMLAIAVRMLPKWVKYELWKRSEPQRTRAEQAAVDAILARLDADFEIALKPLGRSSDDGSQRTDGGPNANAHSVLCLLSSDLRYTRIGIST
jgi:hypothetical protein